MRNSSDIVIEIDVEKAMKDGFKFLRSKNDVILMPGKGDEGQVPPAYFKSVLYKPRGKDAEEIKFQTAPYQYLLILDFEANCVEDGKLECQEIIEFPVVPIDVKNLKILEDKIFHYYVKPTIVPKITDFCTSLTGITQAQVDQGTEITEVIKRLEQFMSDNGFTYENSTIVSCGKWDLNTCLKSEAEYKKLILPDYLKKYINIRGVWMTTFFKSSAPGLKGMLGSLHLAMDGRHHSGIDDTRNTAKIAVELLRRGAMFSPLQDHFVRIESEDN